MMVIYQGIGHAYIQGTKPAIEDNGNTSLLTLGSFINMN